MSSKCLELRGGIEEEVDTVVADGKGAGDADLDSEADREVAGELLRLLCAASSFAICNYR